LNMSLQLLPISGFLNRVTHVRCPKQSNNGNTLFLLFYKEMELFIFISYHDIYGVSSAY
jgi:hypothetical protein